MSITISGEKEFENIPSTKSKALRINLNENIYGSFRLRLVPVKKQFVIFLEPVEPLEQSQKPCLPMIRILAIQFME